MDGRADCKQNSPSLVRYDGYKHMQEDPREIVPCIGPRGLLMNESREDAIWAYPGRAQGLSPSTRARVAQLLTKYRRC